MYKRLLIVLGLAVVGGGIVVAANYSGVKEPMVPTYATNLAAKELSNEAFGKEFPLHFASYLLNNQSDEKTMTRFKGSIPFRKNDNVNPVAQRL